ncbi:MAG: GSCFA domain-containing protein [Bacteroidetes bacterium]|nr:GSCFA domain-containing protein [Bacteroidota bacterium]
MSLSFSLKFNIKPFKIIEAQNSILLTGSCFTEKIGEYLKKSGFNTFINPFGIIYNPISISNSINSVIENRIYNQNDLFLTHEKRYVSFEHHGKFSGNEISKVLKNINGNIQNAHFFLKNASCIVITLGTAWAYRLKNNNKIVANCHKVPNNQFAKELLSIDTICQNLVLTIENLRNFNKNIKIIFTVSPVKHLADGIVENLQSKSVLLLSIKEILDELPENNYYFPSYEIVTDELRDYRFYENDHAHPTLQATEYVWQRFVNTCFTESATKKVDDAMKLNKMLNHRQIVEGNEPNPDIFERIKLFLETYKKQK